MSEDIKFLESNILIVSSDRYNSTNDKFYELLKEYERVIIESISSAFLLDTALIKDRIGGNVDTIHNVRNGIEFKNKENEKDYLNRGDYDSNKYHSHKNYKEVNKTNSNLKKEGNLYDSYTGEKFSKNDNVDLDHFISAKEIHDDKGRVLAGLSGEELANKDSNLYATDRSINRSKKQESMEDYLKRIKDQKEDRNKRIAQLKERENLNKKEKNELNKLEKQNKLNEDEINEISIKANKEYNDEINKSYYSSKKFFGDTVGSSLKIGGSVAIRQGLGFVFTEIFISLREDLESIKSDFDSEFKIKDFINKLIESFKKAITSVKENFGDMLERICDGFLAGILSDITSTIINIFFTTLKSMGKIFRSIFISMIESIKILLINKDGLSFGEQIKAVSKLIIMSISISVGSIIQNQLSKIILIPALKNIVPIFIGSLTTGLLSVSILYYMDNSKIISKFIDYINNRHLTNKDVLNNYIEINEKLDRYAAELAEIDYEEYQKDLIYLKNLNESLSNTEDSLEINKILTKAIEDKGIKLQYSTMEEMDLFMNDLDSKLIF